MRIAFLLFWLPCAVAVAATPDGLGTNLETLRDSCTSRPFADPFKTSRPWISGSTNKWSDERAVKLDPQGWVASLLPGQIARTMLFWDMDGRFPSGQYIVTYEGQGQLSYFGGAR